MLAVYCVFVLAMFALLGASALAPWQLAALAVVIAYALLSELPRRAR